MTDKQDKSYFYTKDQEGFAVMKTKDQLQIGDTIISKEEYDEICGNPIIDKQIIIDKDKFEKAENEPINQEAVNKFIEETDKFYINNVDITKCEFCDYKNYEYPMCEQKRKRNELNIRCELRQNCHYKNWKRKEQECEKAKQNAQDTYDLWQALIESFNILQSEKIKLEQECEELKEENKEIRKYQYEQEFLQQQLDQLKAENEHLSEKEEEVKHYLKEAEKFKNCLIKIKEIAEDTKDKFYDAIHTGGLYDRLEQILQKINEVKDVESN